MAIQKAINTNPKYSEKKDKDEQGLPKVSLEAQERLAEILNDSPHLVSLNGTEWEVRALRMGTQWLIAQKVIEINKAESATFGDIIKQFSTNIPAILDVLTLCLLNDKERIYKNGNEREGFSDEYIATRNTLEWECNVSTFGEIFFEVLQMIDVSFFTQALDMLQIFRATITEMKRMRIKGQK